MSGWTTLRVVHFSGRSQPLNCSDSLRLYMQESLIFIKFHSNVPNVPHKVPKRAFVSICFYYNVPNVPNVPL